MKLTPDDSKLTAYALGDLDATERDGIETALARSPECRRAVAEIRALAGELTTELAQDAATATLAPVGRDSVEPQLERSEHLSQRRAQPRSSLRSTNGGEGIQRA